jgi:anti-anti-sigma regulatory factor
MTAPRALPPELTIYTVAEFKDQCLAWMGEPHDEAHAPGQHWAIDASALDQVDAAGLQLLVSLSQSLDHPLHGLQLLQPSDTLVAACVATGLNGWLATCHPGAQA